MPIYKQTTELTKCADWLTAAAGHDIQYVFFGDKQVFTVWGEYDGTLPAQYSANGSALADYRIYGNVGSVGDDSGTPYGYAVPMAVRGDVDINKNDGLYGYTIKPQDNTIIPNNDWWVSWYIPVVEGATYTGINTGKDILLYSEIDGTATGATGFRDGYTIPQGKHYMKLNAPIMYMNTFTVSVQYPSTPIYIGNTPLGEDESISYSEQKVYRMSGGVLTPTDPPVSLPALPTIDGTNIVDYAGQSAAVPSRFYAKYRKEGY